MKFRIFIFLVFAMLIQLDGWIFRNLSDYTVKIYVDREFVDQIGFKGGALCDFVKNPDNFVGKKDQINSASIFISRIKLAFSAANWFVNILLIFIFAFVTKNSIKNREIR